MMEEFMKLNVDELIDEIKLIVDDPATLEILKSERINGLAFVDLTEDDLKSINLKLGPRKCFIKIIDALKTGKYEEMFDSRKRKADSATVFISDPSTALAQNQQNIPSVPSCSKDHCSKSIFSRYGTVHNTLINNPHQGEKIVFALQNNCSTENDRRALIRILVSELVDYHGDYYPPVEAKTALAKAIVSEFPSLKDNRCPNGHGHEIYFDPNTKKGFIEFRLFTMRKKLPISKKKYRLSGRTDKSLTKLVPENANPSLASKEKLETYVCDTYISAMKSTVPTPSNKIILEKYLRETFTNRREWMKKGQSVSKILSRYPRLLALNGEMIEYEYLLLHPNAIDKFLNTFPTEYVPKILTYLENTDPGLNKKCAESSPDDLNFRALVALAHLLPAHNNEKFKNKRKGGRKRPHEEIEENDTPSIDPTSFLIQFVPEGTNLNQFTFDLMESQSKSVVQPILINVSSKADDDESKMYLCLEKNFIELGREIDIMVAFDLLYKSYSVFNLPYPDELKNFYNFLDFYLYSVESKPNDLVSSLHMNIWNTNVLGYRHDGNVPGEESDKSTSDTSTADLHHFLFQYNNN